MEPLMQEILFFAALAFIAEELGAGAGAGAGALTRPSTFSGKLGSAAASFTVRICVATEPGTARPVVLS